MESPLFAMLFLVMLMFLATFIVRMMAVRRGQVSLRHFEAFEGNPPPAYVTRVSNNLNNLFQVPPIFYAAAVLVIALNIESQSMIFSAWAFVGCRYLHTLVHVSFNRVRIRAAAFGLSLFFLAGLWVELAVKLLAAGGG